VRPGLDIAFFGSSLVSAYWNGAATYYRGLIRALAGRGHRVTFFEPDAYDRQGHRDIPNPSWARVVVYGGAGQPNVEQALARATGADVVVKASGVGVYDEWLETNLLSLRSPTTLVAFWDVDAPATLERMAADPRDHLRALISEYDVVFTYGGGDPVVSAYRERGATRCVPIYNALDPATHRPEPAVERFAGDVGFLGNRLPDREARVERFFLHAAEALPGHRFVLGGSGWGDRALPPNVRYVGHVYTQDHNRFNASVRLVLNINRDSMARFGFSPATRVFEAAGAAACVVTDAFAGIELFLEPGREVLVVEDGDALVRVVLEVSAERARAIGAAARARVLAHHTYRQRAQRVDETLAALRAGLARRPLASAAGAKR
jgi:spore maturation protein CgeB